MKRVVMTPNPYRDKNFKTVLAARDRLERMGVEAHICLPFDVDKSFELPRNIPFEDIQKELPKAEMLVCFGGDGTILHASKAAARAGIPILGVNIGTMGFMAELENTELDLLDRLARDEYEIDRRMMLDVKVVREGQTLLEESCLNDVVIAKGAVARIVHLTVFCDGIQAMSYGGDGLIVATPTGSTAYNLSAGGPIVEPAARNILITPICAHDVQTRGIVASDQRTVSVKICKIGRKNAFVSADGGRAMRLNTGDTVVVSRSKLETQLVRIKDRSFYDIISNKFKNQ